MMPVRGAGHRGTEHDPGGTLSEQRKRKLGEHCVLFVVLPRLEVIARPQLVEPSLLRKDRKVKQVRRAELLMGEDEAELGFAFTAGAG